MRAVVIVLAGWLIRLLRHADPSAPVLHPHGGAARSREPAASTPSPHGTVLVDAGHRGGLLRYARNCLQPRCRHARRRHQYSNWAELLWLSRSATPDAKLERSGRFLMAAADAASRVDGTLVLRVHLDELYHDAATSPASRGSRSTAQLSDPSTRAGPQRRFVSVAPAKSYDADGAVAGLRQALDQALDDLVDWVAAAQR